MAQWYLESSPDVVSGYESDDLDYYAISSFNELLNSNIGKTVVLYESDFLDNEENKDGTEIRCILQNRIKDTKLNSLKRLLITNINTCKAGMYVKVDNRFWIITGLVDNNGMFEKCVMELCEYCLRWQNEDLDIIHRWCNIKSASQYNNGETANNKITLSSDQLMVMLPMDDETIELDNPQRFFISKSIKKKKVYKLTRNDSEVYDYQDSGIINLIVSKDSYDKEKDVVYDNDGNFIWICDYNKAKINNEIIDNSYLINIKYSGESSIVVGGNRKKFTANLIDSDGNITESVYGFNFSINTDNIIMEQTNNYVYLQTDDSSIAGKTFKLTVTDIKTNIESSIDILVSSF